MNALAIFATLPIVSALSSLAIRNLQVTRIIVPFLTWLQLACATVLFWPALSGKSAIVQLGGEFSADRVGSLFLLLTVVVVAGSFTHAAIFFEKEQFDQAGNYNANHERLFYAFASLFLLAMIFVFICDNLGFLWISIEATTLCSAALVYFARTKHALEATWKYLIICSVGIAFALLGTVLLFASTQHGAFAQGSLNIRELMRAGPLLQYQLLRLGYIFCFLGYGTKAGIFPLHSWLPDAHSEAPSPASAMLSGALLNCALFAIFRLSQLLVAANHGALPYTLAVGLGTITTLAASFFLIRQHGIKRLWAYSSIENVGLMLIAIGFNSSALFFLQALNHSIAKVSLFLLSGNIVQLTGTKELSEIRGVLSICPAWAILITLSAFAVTGAPPFGAFISEWLILARSADSKLWIVLGCVTIALAISFIAVCSHLGKILFGTAHPTTATFRPFASSAIPVALVAGAVVLGITALPALLVVLK